MPIYEYDCAACKERFEELVAASREQDVRCPSCGSSEVERVMSTFATEWKPSNVN
jgi:putative FmdB family regulatory protein